MIHTVQLTLQGW